MATSLVSISDGDSTRESDYGSDFSVGEENIVNRLLENLKATTTTTTPTAVTTATTTPTGSVLDPTQSVLSVDLDNTIPANSFSSLPAIRRDQYHVSTIPSPWGSALSANANSHTGIGGKHISDDTSSSRPSSWSVSLDGVQYPDLSRALSGIQPQATPVPGPAPTEREDDTRSPLERFRSFPKKPLTVSDLASGAWCELQYSYILTRLPGGRKTRTAAMMGGSRVHQTLEDQVHTTVQVDITTKEEAFALRLWNVIQGLRTLRDTGVTRELEVWGTIEGQVVNGIIDELSYESPNASFEEELRLSQSTAGNSPISSNQQSFITDYLEPSHQTIYLTDVKTRASERLPTGAALRPARVQLFLYHRLLGCMASGMVDFSAIIDRYGLKAEARFSDAFIAQVGGLHDEIFYDADPSPNPSPQMTPPSDLIGYRSIEQIIPLLESELRDTFPRGAANLGDLLAVQYRHRDDGRIIGNNSFPNDPEALDGYIRQNFRWWRGEREAEGVVIEETYKCRSCEFADSCQWRKDKEADLLQKRRNLSRMPS
ncbi:exonuclease V [Xylariaceae sp. FL0662B]|nr:exonuclease V [Xylariaceae sp. FL0662B]